MKHCKNDCLINAVDFSENMIAKAKEKHSYSNVEFILEDVYKLDSSYQNYDLCICYSVFPHFIDKKKVIDILSKRIKKGGKLVIAHTQSREEINNIHRGKKIAVKYDKLPPAWVVSNYLDKSGIKTIKAIDNNELYLIVGQKS